MDGNKLIATNGRYVFTSSDGGLNWAVSDGCCSSGYYSVGSSYDGNKLVVTEVSGPINSSIDGGGTWTQKYPRREWTSVASSADGTKLVASVYGEQIYTSIDGGNTWIASGPSRKWNSVAISADGTKLAASVSTGQIYTYSFGSTVGATGSISGGQNGSIELQYQGNGQFGVLSHEGSLTAQ